MVASFLYVGYSSPIGSLDLPSVAGDSLLEGCGRVLSVTGLGAWPVQARSRLAGVYGGPDGGLRTDGVLKQRPS